MSEHTWVKDNLDAYVAGALSVKEQERIDRHVDGCGECAHLKSEIGEVDQLLDSIFTRVRPDVGLEDRAIHQLRRAPRPRPSWMRVVVAAAAVIFLGMIGGGVQMLATDGVITLPGMEPKATQVAQREKNKQFELGVDIVGGTIHEGRNHTSQNDPFMVFDEEISAIHKQIAQSEQRTDQRMLVMGQTEVEATKGREVTLKVQELEKSLHKADPPPIRSKNESNKDKAKEDGKEGFYDLALDKIQREKMPAMAQTAKLKVLEDTYKNMDDLKKYTDKPGKEGLDTKDSSAKLPGFPSPGETKPRDTDGKPLLTLPVLPTTSPPPGPAPYLPMIPPPVIVAKTDTSSKEKEQPGSSKETGGGQNKSGEPKPNPDGSKPGTKVDPKIDPKAEPKQLPPQDTGRKIIRSGEMEFETDSFKDSVREITKLVKSKGGFVATINSDQLPNKKVRGSIVVRMPPAALDDFLLELPIVLPKNIQKNQRIGSQDVTKQYTDIESRLRAARAIEERLIQIIKTGKGEIKDLIAAERELGTWRTKIEEMEGEIRYLANQVSLSTLTILLFEKEIEAPTAIVITETVQIRLEVDDVARQHKAAMKFVKDIKGRLTHSELKLHPGGQLVSVLHVEIKPDKKDKFLEFLDGLGRIADKKEMQNQHTEGGSGKPGNIDTRDTDVCFQITLNNTANIKPSLSTDLKIAATDVPGSYAKLLAKIAEVKGQVRDGRLNEQDKLNKHAFLDFNVPTTAKPAIDKLLEEIGAELERLNVRAQIHETSTESKHGYTVTLRDLASIPPRQTIVETIAVSDVPANLKKVKDAILALKLKGKINDAKLNEHDKLNVTARIDFTVPIEEKDTIRKVLDGLGTLLTRDNVPVPANQLANDKKIGFTLTLRDFAGMPPSKAAAVTAATHDVPAAYDKLLKTLADPKVRGQVVDAKLNEQDRLNVTAQIDFSVSIDDKEMIDKMLEDFGAILSRTNVQQPMSVQSIAKKFGYSVTLRDFANIPPSHSAKETVATIDVPGHFAKLVKAVVDAKGQLSVANLDEQDKLNVRATLAFAVPIAEKAAFDELLEKMGTLLSRKNEQAPPGTQTTERKFGYAIELRDFANIVPRETFQMQLAAVDVPASFRKLQDAVAAAKGQVSVGRLEEDAKVKIIEAKFDFNVPTAETVALEKLFREVGAIVTRTSSQVPVNELATDKKVGYRLTIRSTAAIPPRETVTMKLEVRDVDARSADVKEMVAAAKGRIIDSNIDRHENGQVSAVLKIEIPFASEDNVLKQVKGVGSLVSQQAKRHPHVAENELTTAHIIVTLSGTTPIVPSDEGLGSYVRASLAMSFKIFSVCVMLIILGVSAVLPWALVIWLVYKAYVHFYGSRGPELATATGPTPPAAEPPPA